MEQKVVTEETMTPNFQDLMKNSRKVTRSSLEHFSESPDDVRAP